MQPRAEVPNHFIVPTYNNWYATSEIDEQTTHAYFQTSVDLPDGQIDYFAGCRDDVFLPVPSIAERAKTRKRKSKVKHSQALQDIIELTDDDEFMPNQPPSKSKKKIKEKAVQDLPETDQSASSAPAPQLFQSTNDLIMINSRNKVQPWPFKMTPGPISEVTPQNSTSSLSSPLDRLAKKYPHSGLPPDLPLTRPLTQDRDIHPPPIEFLPPPQEDTDPPLLSSQSEENRRDQLYADPGDNVLPPATFFVGSSSLAPPVLTTPLPPQPQSADMVNSTSMVIEPLKDANANINTRTRNTRKPRKKQGEVGNVDFDAPQICEKEKAGINQVIVEIPLPSSPMDRDQSPVLNSRKRRRKQILDDHTEDELNIGAGQPDPIVDVSAHHPSPLLESDKGHPQGDPDTLYLQNLTEIPKLQKRKGKKCKSGQDIDDDAPFAPIIRRKKKTLHSIEAGEQEQTFEDPTVSSKKTSKREKKGSEESGKDDNIQVSRMKGKRRMIITSDDESDGNVDLIVVEEARISSPDPEEYLKASEDSPFLNDSAEAADHQDDRNVLRVSHYYSYSYDRRY